MVGTQFCYVLEEELKLALHVGVDGCGGEDAVNSEVAVEGLDDVGGLFYADILWSMGEAVGCEGLERDGLLRCKQIACISKSLQHEARHLPFVASCCAGVVEQGDAVGSLHESVVIVGVEAHFALYGGHAEGGAKGVGNEGWPFVGLWYLSFVDGEHDDVAEVEVACFEKAHDLQPCYGFAVEGYGGLFEQLQDES